MSDSTLRLLIEERQRQAGSGVPINITDLVASSIAPPPGYTMKLVNKEEAQQRTESRWDTFLRDVIMNQFTLTEAQLLRFESWNMHQNNIIKARNNGELRIGASGGHIAFEFTPSGLGTFVRVKNELTGDVLDLTEGE